MKTVYEAANTVDAHMVLNLLQQAGIPGTVIGEYLQGGMGELPAAGLVRVAVDEQDVSAAREVISAWEAQEPELESEPEPEPEPELPRHPGGKTWVLAAVAGFVLGAAVMFVILFLQN